VLHLLGRLSLKVSVVRESLFSTVILRTRGGVFRCERPHFLVQKTSNFSKFMMCSHEQGARECEHFVDKGESGVNFSKFCADVFYGRPLTIQS